MIVKLSVLLLSGIVGLVCNCGSCWLSSCSSANLIFVFNMTGSFSILLSSWNHTLPMIASKLFSLFANNFFHYPLINSNMFLRSKAVLSNSCIYLNNIKASFSKVMAIFHYPFWLLLSPTCQTSMVICFLRVWIHFIYLSGVVELMYSMTGIWSILPWLSNNPKGVGLYWLC